ncbi:hypothetical protein F4861DRAFT_61859 [Xylaria intraflava]|nr:hypothetical protein F4861DRAFT_61859 [Xylaria intraflava]
MNSINSINHIGGISGISDAAIRALDAARDTPELMDDRQIRDILESALAEIWGRVLANESGYVMSRDEFAIFNFFQDRFRNNPVAVSARKRFWDSLIVPPTEAESRRMSVTGEPMTST